MNERRRRRSGRKDEALTLLLEAVRTRSEISSIAITAGPTPRKTASSQAVSSYAT